MHGWNSTILWNEWVHVRTYSKRNTLQGLFYVSMDMIQGRRKRAALDFLNQWFSGPCSHSMLRLDATAKKRYDSKLFKFKKFSIKLLIVIIEFFSSCVKATTQKKTSNFFLFRRFYLEGWNATNKSCLFNAKFFEFEEFF